MKKIAWAVAALLLLCMAMNASAESLVMDLYYVDPCGGCGTIKGRGCRNCDVEMEIAARYRKLFSDYALTLNMHNVRLHPEYQQERDEVLANLGLDPDAVPYPTLILNGRVFLADGTMDDAVVDFVATGDGAYPGLDSLLRQVAEYKESVEPGRVVYLYSPYCEDCKTISKYLARALPADYELVKYDISTIEGVEMEEYYREALGISDDAYVVPCVIYGDYWFCGKDSIYLSLLSRIQEYPNEQTYVKEERSEEGD